MVEVALRNYSEEIDGLIDQGAFDAAIAHCQHVLKTYPKYLKAYSMIGKTALEKGDLEAAADLFSRVLSMDPEDFVARVGMSIASDREGALDLAIWHMERAFELAPDNQAIVGELCRLYGRRDGVEPEKISLTQGALARLHARGNLHTQAVNELNRMLNDDPNRVDLQVALAETFWRADRRIEAAETSLAILERLPYCLKANLILGEIWISSGREAEGEAHLDRARMIDPENEAAQELFDDRSPLPPAVAKIARMEYIAPPAPADQEPDWLQSLIDDGASPAATDEAVPDWLQAVAASVGEEVADSLDAAAPEAGQVPDWLQDAAATADLEAEDFVSTPGALAAVETEMPDWLAELTTEPEAAAGEPLAPEEIPDWLAEIESGVEEPTEDESFGAGMLGVAAGVAAAAAAAARDEEEPEEAGEEIPDWLAAAETATTWAEADAEPSVTEEPELAAGEIPDWLAEMMPTEVEDAEAGPTDIGFPTVEEAELEAGEMPDWLTEPTRGEIEGIEEAPVAADELGLAPADIPDWLAEMAPPEVADYAGEAALDERAPDVADMDVAPAEVPDWLAEEAPPTAEEPEEEVAVKEPEATSAPLVAAETPDWLTALVAAAGVTLEETVEPAEELAELEEAELAETAAPEVEQAEVKAEELPDWLTEEAPAEVEEAETEAELMARMEDMSPEDAFAAWEAMLAESEIDQAAPELEQEVTAPEAEAEGLPDWLVEEAPTEVAEAETEADLMARMEDMSPEEAFAAWEAMLAQDEDEEAAVESVELAPETRAKTGPIVIEEPEKEPLIYPEGAGGEVTEAEAELMARMEDMSPEEAFAAWEAMLAESEIDQAAPELEQEVTAPEAEAEGLPDWLVEEAPTEVAEAETEAELMARMEDMSPEEAFAAWEAMLAQDEAVEEEMPLAEADVEAEDAWMALIEDTGVEDVAEPAPVVDVLPTEHVVEVESVAEEFPAEPEDEDAWMPLVEDEAPAHAVAEAVELDEVTAPAPPDEALTLEAYEAPEPSEEPEVELPDWATAEAIETPPETAPVEEEITLGPDVVLLTEEEEAEIRAAKEPEPSVPVEVSELILDEEMPTVEAEALAVEAPLPDVEEPAPATEAAVPQEPAAEIPAHEAPVAEEALIEPDDDAGHLELARRLWTAGKTEEAHAEYERLLRSPLRTEVIHDLESVTAQDVPDEATLRLLGDAYMKDNRLQEALEVYRRALSSL
jgi:tetratricopeptide (TPR) repeat protein